jgi:hypothetical protein
MSEPRELFLHELGDVLYAERTLVNIVPTLQEEALDEELAVGFEEHLDETRQHVKNVEQAFEKLSEKPTAGKCRGIEGSRRSTTISSPRSLVTENLEQEKTALEKRKAIGKRLARNGAEHETRA